MGIYPIPPSIHSRKAALSLESRWLLDFSSLSCCVLSKLNLVTKYLVYLEIYRSNITGSIPVASTIVQRQVKHSFVIFHHTTTRYAIHIAKWQRHTAMLKVLSFSWCKFWVRMGRSMRSEVCLFGFHKGSFPLSILSFSQLPIANYFCRCTYFWKDGLICRFESYAFLHSL